MEELAGLVGLLEWVQEEQVWYLGLVDPVELEQEPLNLEKVCCKDIFNRLSSSAQNIMTHLVCAQQVTVLVDLEFYQVEVCKKKKKKLQQGGDKICECCCC